MIVYQELMEHMAREGSVTDSEEARRALEATAKALARHTSPDTRLGAWAPGGREVRGHDVAHRAQGSRPGGVPLHSEPTRR